MFVQKLIKLRVVPFIIVICFYFFCTFFYEQQQNAYEQKMYEIEFYAFYIPLFYMLIQCPISLYVIPMVQLFFCFACYSVQMLTYLAFIALPQKKVRSTLST
uniref:Uncharacterized protein n=1 Tax=Cacopsylla melanoneura TaxID=428564 RepID=A0A8D8ZH02_9HEMI